MLMLLLLPSASRRVSSSPSSSTATTAAAAAVVGGMMMTTTTTTTSIRAFSAAAKGKAAAAPAAVAATPPPPATATKTASTKQINFFERSKATSYGYATKEKWLADVPKHFDRWQRVRLGPWKANTHQAIEESVHQFVREARASGKATTDDELQKLADSERQRLRDMHPLLAVPSKRAERRKTQNERKKAGQADGTWAATKEKATATQKKRETWVARARAVATERGHDPSEPLQFDFLLRQFHRAVMRNPRGGLFPIVNNVGLSHMKYKTFLDVHPQTKANVQLVEICKMSVNLGSVARAWNMNWMQLKALKLAVGPRYAPGTNEAQLTYRYRYPLHRVLDETTVYDPLIREVCELATAVKDEFPVDYVDRDYMDVYSEENCVVYLEKAKPVPGGDAETRKMHAARIPWPHREGELSQEDGKVGVLQVLNRSEPVHMVCVTNLKEEQGVKQRVQALRKYKPETLQRLMEKHSCETLEDLVQSRGFLQAWKRSGAFVKWERDPKYMMGRPNFPIDAALEPRALTEAVVKEYEAAKTVSVGSRLDS